MNDTLTYDFYKKLEKDQLAFVYSGQFSEDIIKTAVNFGEKKVEGSGGSTRIKQKITSLIAESFKNIILHADKPNILHNTNNKPSMFMARRRGESYSMTSANLVDSRKTDALKSKLDKLSSPSPAGDLASVLSAKKSGLGLLEMVKRAGEKVRFDLEFVNYYFSLFYLQVQLDAGRKKGRTDFSISSDQELYRMMLKHNLMILYKGNFTQPMILSLVEMVENNLKKKPEALWKKKKIFYLLIELLQNISKHAMIVDKSREGIFMVGVKDNKYLIYTGNFVEKAKGDHLKSQIDYFNSLDKKGLADLYKASLQSERKEEKMSGAELGLIDVARYSNDKLQCEFKPVDRFSSFFSLHISA